MDHENTCDPSDRNGYLLGLSISPTSVGWAVTDQQYNLLKYKRRTTWGIHLFDKADTAKERHQYRIARRRISRRKWRLSLLREMFEDQISKVDPTFFSKLQSMEGDVSRTYASDAPCPTIYHLRRHLMAIPKGMDIRDLYLVCHHMIKYRGHFFHEVTDVSPSLDGSISELVSRFEEIGMPITISDMDAFKNALCDDSLRSSEKKRILSKYIGSKNKGVSGSLSGLLSGSNVSLSKMFDGIDSKDSHISFGGSNVEQSLDELESLLDADRFNAMRAARGVYEAALLHNLLSDSDCISDHMVRKYDQHRIDLITLKDAVRKHSPQSYGDVFKRNDVKGNYCSYVNVCGDSKPKQSCDMEQFCKYLQSIFRGTGVDDDPDFKVMMERINNHTFMPKQSGRDNSLFPNSLHHIELERILDNAESQLPFLKEVDDSGFSVKERILQLHSFRIPYFVGPLGKGSKNSWAVTLSNERITPWNFEKVIDMGATAKAFMGRCTCDCMYIKGEKVLPSDSILYSRFRFLDQLNHIRIDDRPLPSRIKRSLIEKMLKDDGTITDSRSLSSCLENMGAIDTEVPYRITGVPSDIGSALFSERALKRILGNDTFDYDELEDIVQIIAVFDDRSRMIDVIKGRYGDRLTDEAIRSLSKLRFRGWSDISKRFLIDIMEIEKVSRDPMNIMEMLEHTSLTFDEILDTYGFRDKAAAFGGGEDRLPRYEDLQGHSLHPSEKRSIWRAISIVRDIVSSLGGSPRRIFVESIHNESYQYVDDQYQRYQNLLRSYERNDESVDMVRSLESFGPKGTRSRNVYLYHAQLGRCIYCGTSLNVDDIDNDTAVNRDHIFPVSKYKDDDIHRNVVLSCRSCNENKGDTYPIRRGVQVRMSELWNELRSKGYISREKFERLTRTEPLIDEECSRSVGDWVVKDNRIVRMLKGLIEPMFDSTEVYGINSNIVSELRHMLGHLRNRSVNDNYHAKDAYLAIVSGNVHLSKYTTQPMAAVSRGRCNNLGRPYSSTVVMGRYVVWSPEYIDTLHRHLRRDDILFTRLPYIQNGPLFDSTIQRAGGGLFNKKRDLPSEIYGGYTKERGACYSLVEYHSEGKTFRSLEVLERHSLHLLENPIALQKHYSDRRGTVVHVIQSRIHMSSLLIWNGFPMHIGGRTNVHIMFNPALQLLLPDDLHDYCRRIQSYIRDSSPGAEYHGLDRGMNEALYDHLLMKVDIGPYSSVMPSLKKNLYRTRDDFLGSDLWEQATVLWEILKSFRCDASFTSLKSIGGVGSTGRIILNSVLPEESEGIYLVNQSPSGLNENRIRLDKGDI